MKAIYFRELRNYFNTPIGYVFVSIFMLLTGVFFVQSNIAAASVLAKTHRDEYMMRLHEEYPHYNWKSNKGYPTRDHRLAIREYGLSPYHRLSFNHNIGQLELF